MLLGGGFFVFVDRTPLEDCTMSLFIVSTARGQYLAIFEYVRPVHVSNFPHFISLSHVDLKRNPDAACMYRTSDFTLGILYALYAEGVALLIY